MCARRSIPKSFCRQLLKSQINNEEFRVVVFSIRRGEVKHLLTVRSYGDRCLRSIALLSGIGLYGPPIMGPEE